MPAVINRQSPKQGNCLLTGQDFRPAIAGPAGPFPLGLAAHLTVVFPVQPVQSRRRRYRPVAGRMARPCPAMLRGKGSSQNLMPLARNAPRIPVPWQKLRGGQPAAAHLIALLRRGDPGVPRLADPGYAV